MGPGYDYGTYTLKRRLYSSSTLILHARPPPLKPKHNENKHGLVSRPVAAPPHPPCSSPAAWQ